MFVYTVRASTIRFFGVLCVSLAVLIALVAFLPAYLPTAATANDTQSATVSYEKIKEETDVRRFLAQFGWEVDAASLQTAKVTLPAEFDKIFNAYNDLQKRQGLDLSRYKNKEVTRYTYTLTNYTGEDTPVLANVLVYRERVIGGDLCSSDVNGFVSGFSGK